MLPDSIRGAARRFGDRPAVIDASGAPLSYADLDRWSDELAVSLPPGTVSARQPSQHCCFRPILATSPPISRWRSSAL